MRHFVTGVAGHLGSQLAQSLLAQGHEVVGVDNLSAGFLEEVPLGVRFIDADLCRNNWKCEVFGSPIDTVWHAASFAAEGLSPYCREYTFRNVAVASSSVINEAIRHDVRRLVYFSSMAVYGHGSPPFDERSELDPCDTYGVAKAAVESDLEVAANYHGLEYTILRPHNLYGPHQNIWQKYRNVLGLWMRSALEGESMKVFGDGHQQRAFSYLPDAMHAILNAGSEPGAAGQAINIGGSKPISILEAAAIVSEVTGASIEHVDARREVNVAFCTTQKSKDLLGYEDSTTMREGIERMWDWAREAWCKWPERRRPPNVEVEVDKGIYSYWR